jgi:hypothetical protein
MVAAVITLNFNVLLWRAGPAGIPVPVAFAGSVLCLALILGLAVAALVFGIRGWQRSLDAGESPAFGISGALLSGVALATWLGVAADLIAIFLSFMR